MAASQPDDAALDEDVHLQAHDPAWAGTFLRERAALAERLGRDGLAIEHIGSTAVAGLLAKPVVDLMIGVPSFEATGAIEAALRHAGYEALGPAGVEGRLYFRKRRGAACNAHVVVHGGPLWWANLAFREHLRASATARDRYAAAKQAALAAGHGRLLAYSAAKSAVVAALLHEALRGRGDTEPLPCPPR